MGPKKRKGAQAQEEDGGRGKRTKKPNTKFALIGKCCDVCIKKYVSFNSFVQKAMEKKMWALWHRPRKKTALTKVLSQKRIQNQIQFFTLMPV